MIFSVITKDSDSAKQSIGYLGKSFSDMGLEIKKAEGIWGKTKTTFGSLFSSQSSIDKSNFSEQLQKDIVGLKAYASANAKAENLTGLLDETMGNCSQTAKDFAVQANRGAVDIKKFEVAQSGAATASKGLAIAAGFANAAITLGASLLVTWLIDLTQAQQKAIDKSNELTSAWKEQQDAFKSNISTLEGLKPELSELAKGIDENGINIGLSADKYQRYKDIVQQIVDISPSVVRSWTAEGDALVDNNTVISEAIRLQKELNEQKRQEYLASGGDILKGARAEADKARQQFQEGLWAWDNTQRDKLQEVLGIKDWDMGGTKKEIEALLSSMDIDTSLIISDRPIDFEAGNVEFQKIVDKQDELLAKLKEQGLLKDEDIQKTKSILDLLDIEQSKIDSANQKVATFLSIWSSAQENTDWHGKIDTGYLDELSTAINEISSDPTKSIEEMQVAVRNLGKSFLEIQNQLPTEQIETLKKQFADGQISADEFKSKMAEQISVIDELATKYPELMALLNLIANGFRQVSSDAQETANQTSVLSVTLSSLLPEFQKLESSFSTLSSAQDELSNSGAITVSTLQSLMDNNLLQYLDTVDGKLQINTQRFLEDADATKTNALLKLQNAMQTDIMNYAIGKTEALSDTAKAAIANLGANVETSGNQAAGASGQYIGFAAAVDAAIKASEGKGVNVNSKEISSGIQAIADSYKPWFSALEKVDVSLKTVSGTAKNTSNDIKQAMQSAKSAIDSLVSSVVTIIKQGYNAEIDSYRDLIDGIKDRYDSEKEQAKSAWEEKEDYYNAELGKLKDIKDSYNKIIEARKNSLKDEKDQADHEKELSAKQKEISDLENGILELGNDKSIDGIKRRLELEEELANKKNDLDDFQSDYAYNTAVDALDKELDAYNEQIDAKIEGLEKQKQAAQELHDQEMSWLEEQNNTDIAYYESEIQRLQDYMSEEGTLRQEAMQQITDNIQNTDLQSNALYQKLLEWNRLYGTGIDADITNAWMAAQSAMQTYGGEQMNVYATLEYITSKMNDLVNSVQGAGSAFSDAASKAADFADEVRRANDLFIGDRFYYEKYQNPQHRIYHDGTSSVGSGKGKVKSFDDIYRKIKNNEVPAILEKGEAVISNEDKPKWESVLADYLNADLDYSSMKFPGGQFHDWNQIPLFASGNSSLTNNLIKNGPSPVDVNINVAGNLDRSVIPEIEKAVYNAINNPKTKDDYTKHTVDTLVKNSYNRGIVRNAKFGVI